MKRYLLRSHRILAAVICILLLQLLPVSNVYADQYVHPEFQVMVNSSAGEINLRSGAGTAYEILTTVPNGTVLYVTDMAYNMPDQFFYGYVKYGQYWGWVSLRQTQVMNGGGYQTIDFYVSASADAGSINFRTSPSLSAPVITDIWNGTAFHITNISYNPNDGFFWGYTVYNGRSGWISLRQTNFRRDYGNTPSYSIDNGSQAAEPATNPPRQDQPPVEAVQPGPGSEQEATQAVQPDPGSEQEATQTVQPGPGSEQEATQAEDDDPFNGIYCLYNGDEGKLQSYSEEGITYSSYYSNGYRITFEAISVGQPGDYPSYSDWPHYAEIHGMDGNGNSLWEVVTDEVYTLNGGYTAIGPSKTAFYYSDYDRIYALDLRTGQLLWTNEDAGKIGAHDGGFSGKAVGKEGELYICSTNGGGFLVVDARGRTLTVRGGLLPMHSRIADIRYDGEVSTVTMENEDGQELQITVKR